MADDDLRPRGRGFESLYTDVSDKAIGITFKIKKNKRAKWGTPKK
jgi:hypothetical protein